jgi:hypothetical protein
MLKCEVRNLLKIKPLCVGFWEKKKDSESV